MNTTKFFKMNNFKIYKLKKKIKIINWNLNFVLGNIEMLYISRFFFFCLFQLTNYKIEIYEAEKVGNICGSRNYHH